MKVVLQHPFPGSTPILSLDQARDLEKRVLKEDPDLIEEAVVYVGHALAYALLRDYNECQRPKHSLRLLLLIGKGHNGADALASACVLAELEKLESILVLTCAQELKALTQKKLGALEKLMEGRIKIKSIQPESKASSVEAELMNYGGPDGIDLCIDGLLGMSARPELKGPMAAIVGAVNEYPHIGLRVAVDMPTGLGQETVFQADLTYATGSAKSVLFNPEVLPYVGRVRLLDIGFFEHAGGFWTPDEHVPWLLSPKALKPLGGLRDVVADKRTFGHVVIVAGSRTFPGAAMMAAHAALRSGVGLVTACVPESLMPSFAAVLPEVMWTPWPETPEGQLSEKGMPLLKKLMDKATAVLIGPGLGRSEEIQSFVERYARSTCRPSVFDADVLQPSLLEAIKERTCDAGPTILTPHMGEYERLIQDQEDKNPETLARRFRVVFVKKGPHTALYGAYYTYINTLGGPILARGGSGDILAGLIAGLLAQSPQAPLQAAALGTLWHGYAADRLAQAYGHRSIRITELLDHL